MQSFFAADYRATHLIHIGFLVLLNLQGLFHLGAVNAEVQAHVGVVLEKFDGLLRIQKSINCTLTLLLIHLSACSAGVF